MPSIMDQLHPLFEPRSVAIIGATNDLRRWGGWVVDRPKRTSYKGRLYPVNPREPEILETIAALDYIDGIITAPIGVGGGDNLSGQGEALLDRITSLPERFGKTLVVSGFGGAAFDNPVLRRYRDAGIPAFTAEDYARATFALARHGEVQRGE